MSTFRYENVSSLSKHDIFQMLVLCKNNNFYVPQVKIVIEKAQQAKYELSRFFLAFEDDTLVGFANIVAYNKDSIFELQFLLVDREYRTRGIGAQLMSMTFEYYTEHMYPTPNTVRILAVKAEKDSVKYFMKKGFFLTGQMEQEYYLMSFGQKLQFQQVMF